MECMTLRYGAFVPVEMRFLGHGKMGYDLMRY